MNKTLTIYPELHEWIRKFFEDNGLKLVILVSHPGKGKSWLVRALAEKFGAWYCRASRLAPFQFYKQAFKHRKQNIAFDDLEDPIKEEKTRKTLMAMCETDEEERLVEWYGTNSQLTIRKGNKTFRVPQSFKTSSRVLIVCNDFAILSKNLGPLLSRALVIFFEPSNQEVHRFVGEWFKHQEIYQFIEAHADEIPEGSQDVRWYIQSECMANKGLDWRSVLLETWTNEEKAVPDVNQENIFKEVFNEPEICSEHDKVESFILMMKDAGLKGASRATYFRIKKRLQKNGLL